MSLTMLVIDMVKERGERGATSDELYVELREDGYTLAQIRKAMQGASYAKRLRGVRGKALGSHRGSEPARYFWQEPPPPRNNRPSRSRDRRPSFPISSPWDMAHGIDMPWPPKFTGGRVFLHLMTEDA
jgi:hypothetical protein